MFKFTTLLTVGASVALALTGCQKSQDEVAQPTPFSQDVLTQVKALGFGTQDMKAVDGGYLVEGDILLTPDLLASQPASSMLRVGDDEQYRTNTVVTGLPRVIRVAVSSTLPAAYVTAADAAIKRYNDQKLLVTFSRVTSGGNITLTKAPAGAGYLASAGFPSGGSPYSQVLVNSDAIGTANPTTYIATILAHEMGHCIGFRHTDYANRAYSCGGTAVNEGASTSGANYIPGTAVGPDPNSWMLACIGSGANRPFNANDIKALNYVY